VQRIQDCKVISRHRRGEPKSSMRSTAPVGKRAANASLRVSVRAPVRIKKRVVALEQLPGRHVFVDPGNGLGQGSEGQSPQSALP
jgi:hypothetical protein